MDVTLRLELGLLPSTLSAPVALPEAPEEYWLLLSGAAEEDEPVLRQLVDAALPAIDADGRPVLSLQSGPAPHVLLEVGFRALETPDLTGSAALRPGLRRPVGV